MMAKYKNSALKVLMFLVMLMLCSQTMFSADVYALSPTAAQQQAGALSLRDKIAQMIMSTPGKNGEFISQYHVGGIILMRDEEGTGTASHQQGDGGQASADQIKSRVASYQSKSSLPLLVSSDIEGGKVDRISHLTDLPAPRTMGSADQILGKVSAAGSTMKSLGINMDLAPVVDVSSSGLMTDLGRSFSGDPDVVKQKASAYIRGLHQSGVAATLKHFPGYGDEGRNSDTQYIDVAGIVQSQKEVFDSLKSETDAIMMSNIVYTREDSKNQAVVSPAIVGMARQNFNGVIISDDLTAVSLWDTQYKRDGKRVAVDAVKAGVDILLIVNYKKSDSESSANIRLMIDGIEEAVKNGEISESRIDQSLARINALKSKYVSGYTDPAGGKGAQSGFRFIVLSDTNPGANNQNLNPNFPKALAGIPQHNPVFVIQAGDMIGGVTETRMPEQVDKMWAPFFGSIKAITDAKIPYLPCPGNHDKGYTQALKDGYSRNWLKNYPTPPYNAKGDYPNYYSFDYSNNHFIILDSSNVRLGSTQLQWLAEDLKNTQNKENTFVIMHVPFLSDGMFHSEKSDQDALDLIANAGAKIIFVGHNHVYTEHDYKNVKQITDGTAADDLRGRAGQGQLKDHIFLVVDVLGKDNVKIYPAAMGSGFKKTLDGADIPSAPKGGLPDFNPPGLIGTNCVPGSGADAMSGILSGDGLAYESYAYKSGELHAITIDPNKYDVRYVTAKKATGRAKATVSEILAKTPGAVAGINGGFFEPSGQPTNTVVEEGQLIKGARDNSQYTFMNENGKYRVARLQEIYSYGAENIRNSISSAVTALGLVFNGNNVGGTGQTAPRSGVCITRDGAIKLLASNGIPKGSSLVGGYATIKDFAQEAIDKHGCMNGINLDGGGSTSIEFHAGGKDISLKGERNAASCSSKGFPCQRSVADALVVVPKSSAASPAGATGSAAEAKPASSATGAAVRIDSISGYVAADTTTAPVSTSSPGTWRGMPVAYLNPEWGGATWDDSDSKDPPVAAGPVLASKSIGAPPYFINYVENDNTNGKKVVALTFDLCTASSGFVEGIPKYLQQEGIKATFFVASDWARNHESNFDYLIGAADKSGNKLFEIGSHSKTHPATPSSMFWDGQGNEAAMIEEWKDPYEYFSKKGVNINVCRLPVAAPWRMERSGTINYLKSTTSYCKEFIQYSMWAGDSAGGYNYILDHLKTGRGEIILMHANHPEYKTLDTVQKLIPDLKSKGYEFVTVSELLNNYGGAGGGAVTSGVAAGTAPGPMNQIGCVCRAETTNSLITESPDPSSAIATAAGGYGYDFSQIDPSMKDYGSKRPIEKLSKFEPQIQDASTTFGIPEEVIKGIMMVESNGEPFPAGGQLCNYAGYCGLMQTGHMCAKCHESAGCNCEEFKKGNPKDQIFSGAWYIKELMDNAKPLAEKSSPDYFYWIAIGYNGGPGSAINIREFAAQRLGIAPEKVQWKDVTKEDTKRNQQKVFPHTPGKVEEVYNYAHKVMSVVSAVGGVNGMPKVMAPTDTQYCAYGQIFDYTTIGKYYVNPSFSIDMDYNLNDYKAIAEKAKQIVPQCKNKDNDKLKDCVKDAVDGISTIGDLTLYDGPCDYSENMFSDFVEWADACLKSKDDNCTCGIPLEYDYEKANADEEATITASGKGALQISSESPGVGPASLSGSAADTFTVRTKDKETEYYTKKSGDTLSFGQKGGKDCRVEKRIYKFCAKTKKLYNVYDAKEGKFVYKPVEYKFALDFS